MPSIINRTALILTPKAPFFKWLAGIDPVDAGLQQNEDALEPTVYLIEDCTDDEEYQESIRLNCAAFFEFELSAWYTDPELWPRERTWEVFREWFHIRIGSLVLDMLDQRIEQDELL